MKQTIVITPGEISGVGLEVTLKALSSITKNKSHKNISFVFFAGKKDLETHFDLLEISNLSLNSCSSLTLPVNPGFHWIDSQSSPFTWFKNSVDFCSSNSSTTALVTGPLRKSSFKESGAVGHTDYLRNNFSEPCFMTFFGEIYNSLLLSDHLSLDKVSELNFDLLLNQALSVLEKFFSKTDPAKKIALIGLNPHAGEGGLIGQIDENIHKPFAKLHKDILEGPLPADSFFSPDSYKKYSFVIANYHDQALIPFKLLHGFDGAQASLGLPFVRTSVDHGTADDLYLKNKANPKSMLKAINLAIELLNLN